MRKDKEKVLDEVLSDAQIEGFLFIEAPSAAVNADYHCLVRAYRSMVARDFRRFVTMFREAGRDLDAVGPQGKTALQVIESHSSSTEYAEILRSSARDVG